MNVTSPPELYIFQNCHSVSRLPTFNTMGSIGKSDGAAGDGPAVSTLPASWYREEGFYELERRAIFSKRWMCVTHSLRFRETGEYVNFEIAGYRFFVIRDRQKELKAFLNICRHRAYPVLEKGSGEGGKVSILSCKYHGELEPVADVAKLTDMLRLVIWTLGKPRQSTSIRYCG